MRRVALKSPVLENCTPDLPQNGTRLHFPVFNIPVSLPCPIPIPSSMKRRAFLSSVATGGIALSVPGLDQRTASAATESRGAAELLPGEAKKQGMSAPLCRMNLAGSISRIGQWSLDQLLQSYETQLTEDTIAFWSSYGIDREHGGYLRPDKRTKNYPTTDKDLYSQGRLLWLFSFLYNNFGQKPEYLAAARQGKEALVKHCRVAGNHWGTLYTRDWKMKEGFFDIYADVYMVLGLQEYFKATGDEEAKKLAIETVHAANQVILAPDYLGAGHGPVYEPGIKRLGTWVHLLFPADLVPLTHAGRIAGPDCPLLCAEHFDPALAAGPGLRLGMPGSPIPALLPGLPEPMDQRLRLGPPDPRLAYHPGRLESHVRGRPPGQPPDVLRRSRTGLPDVARALEASPATAVLRSSIASTN